MKNRNDVLAECLEFISQHNQNYSAEQLFAQFLEQVRALQEFEQYLFKRGVNQKLGKMNRNERLKKKRRLFTEWYLNVNKDKPTKVVLIELSEMLFLSERTIQSDLSSETTA